MRTQCLFRHLLVPLFLVLASFSADSTLMAAKQWWAYGDLHPQQPRFLNRERDGDRDRDIDRDRDRETECEREIEWEREVGERPSSQQFSQMPWNWLSLGHLGAGARPWPISMARGVEYGGFSTGVLQSFGVHQSPSWFSNKEEFTEEVISRCIWIKLKSVMSTSIIKQKWKQNWTKLFAKFRVNGFITVLKGVHT